MTSRGLHHDPRYFTNGGGEFGVSYHLEMLGDRERVDRCAAAIRSVANAEGTFCELGAGSGIFSILAARMFERVIAIERDEKMVEVMKDAVRRTGLKNISIYHCDALEVVDSSLLAQVNVLFCEMMSTWLIVEPQVLVMNRVAATVGDHSIIRIPSKVYNLLEVGNYDYEVAGIRLHAPIPQFTGITPPRIISPSVLAYTHDFSTVNDVKIASSVRVRVLTSGQVNCVRLSSIVQLAPNVSFYSTDTLMPPLIVPLCDPVNVLEGDWLEVGFEYQCRSSLETSIFTATVIKS